MLTGLPLCSPGRSVVFHISLRDSRKSHTIRPSLTVCKCKCRMLPAVSFCIIICTKIFFAPYRSQIIFTNNVPFQLFFSYDTLNFVTLPPKDCLSLERLLRSKTGLDRRRNSLRVVTNEQSMK